MSPVSESSHNALNKINAVEKSLTFGSERLPVYCKSSQSLADHTYKLKPALEFLPPLNQGMKILLQDARLYCRLRKHADAVSCLNTALKLASEGRILEDMLSADTEDLNLVLSHIHSRLVEAQLKTKQRQRALEHAHRCIQLNPSHFQNHLRQAAVYRALDQPWLAAKSALTANWLYCSLPHPERRISSQLQFYWQVSGQMDQGGPQPQCLLANWTPPQPINHGRLVTSNAGICSAKGFIMKPQGQGGLSTLQSWAVLKEALSASRVVVLYTPFIQNPSPEELLRAEQNLKDLYPSAAYVYTDPRGVHVLPHTTDWLSTAPGDVQKYYISLGFGTTKEGKFIENICSRMWATLAEARGFHRRPLQKKDLNPNEQKEIYEKILPILDMIQATQLNSGFGPCSGLMESLQFSSLLAKVGRYRERTQILLCCQARLSTAPYLPLCPSANSNPQRDRQTLLQLQADLLDELADTGASSERVWDTALKVGWLEDMLIVVERCYNHKKARRLEPTQSHRLWRSCSPCPGPLQTAAQAPPLGPKGDQQHGRTFVCSTA
uniref:Uncharacterized protein n=1 Tax=Knipowitschia caucasica TaxID=637954 RepID=A0AAV2KVY4_KNICA